MQKNYNQSNRYIFILYGVSDVATRFRQYLQKQGEIVSAYFDKRAGELKCVESVPVYKLGDEPFIESQKRDIIVILCFQDALQHEKVAQQLFKNGYNRVLYLPMGGDSSLNNYQLLRNIYTDFSHGEFIQWNNLPVYHKNEDNLFSNQNAIIRRTEKYISFKCPYPLLCCGTPNLNLEINSKLDNINKFKKYENKNIICLDYYLDFFEYLMTGEGNCETYLKMHGGSRNRNEFIENRKQLLDKYITEMSKGSDFFCNSPIEVMWNEKGYFNIVDGHHRAAFFIFCKIDYLPVITKISDFEKFYQNDIIKKLNIHFIKTELNCPIFHPAFFDINCNNEPRLFFLYRIIFQYIFSNSVSIDRILDASAYDMFFAREFIRWGSDFVAVLNSKKYINFGIINELLHTKNINYINAGESNYNFNCVIFLNGFKYVKNKKETIRWINKVCRSVLILECESKDEVLYILQNTNFQSWRRIGQIFYDNIRHEIIVFNK